MRKIQPPLQNVPVVTVPDELDALVDLVAQRETRVLLEKSGVPVAVLVSTAELDRLDQLDRDRAARFAILDEMRAAFKDVPAEELEREAARALAEVRAEMREEPVKAAAIPQ